MHNVIWEGCCIRKWADILYTCMCTVHVCMCALYVCVVHLVCVDRGGSYIFCSKWKGKLAVQEWWILYTLGARGYMDVYCIRCCSLSLQDLQAMV